MQIIFSITVCNAIYPRSICIFCFEIPLNAFCHHFVWLSCTGTICRVFCVCSMCIYFYETDLMQFVCASGSAVYFSPMTVAVTKTFYPLPICVSFSEFPYIFLKLFSDWRSKYLLIMVFIF